MTTETEDDGKKKPVGGELVIPVVALVFTTYYFWSIWESPWEAQVAAFLVGSILFALIAMFLIRTALEYRAGKVSFGLGPLIEPVWILPKRLVVIALTFGYILLIGKLGFTITSFLFLFLMMAVLGDAIAAPRRLGKYAFVSACLSVGGYLLFIVAFDTRYPNGPFERLMAGAFGL